MKNLFCFITFILFALNSFSQESDEYSPYDIVFKFNSKSNIDLEAFNSTKRFDHQALDEYHKNNELRSVQLTGNKRLKNAYVIRYSAPQDIISLVKMYQSTGLFEYVEPNFISHGAGKRSMIQTIPNDDYFSRQYGLLNDGSFSLSEAVNDADVDMDLAWDVEQGDPSIILAVLDSGAKLDHPEFNGRIWQNTSESLNGLDSDNNGFIDDTRGWDFVNDDNNPTDDHGHGTNVAGIATANGNNVVGYAGVDWNCKLMVCKILDENNSGFYSWQVDAIHYAVDHGARMINMSVGGASFSSSLQDAVNYAYDNGVTIVACMMNEDNEVTYYPAGYQNTIAVGSTNANDQRTSPFFWSGTSGSNFGNHIDVIAPGNYIYGLDYNSNTNYNSYWGGTSQAAPLVAGLGSLLLAQDPSRTPDDIRNIIRNTAVDQVGNPSEDVSGFDKYYGYGRVNAHQALLQSVSTEDVSNLKEAHILVYPNPSSDILNIESITSIEKLSIVNIVGAEVYRKDNISDLETIKIDVAAFAKGSYFIKTTDENKKSTQLTKIIVQ